MNTEQLASLRLELLKAKSELDERLEENRHFDLEMGHYHESMGELSSYDNHPADEGTDLFEREKDIALNEHIRLEKKEIDHALESMEKGTYGVCEVCGNEIPFERLKALPTASTCIEHTLDRITSHERPIEEGVLMPPFGKFDYDEQDESEAFDAEDSWQEVQSWGTSETPSDFVEPMDHYNDVSVEPYENVGYVEDFENFIGNDIDGKNITVYPSAQHERYEEALDEEGIMTTFGDLPAFEHDPYVEDDDNQ
ncbi:MAG TPA: TraR/DksA C4-type zinc finger protein [Chondromyces sp.]|nr:TraR/DksA C4-type zinc finger protein [Chondromyces sp.]